MREPIPANRLRTPLYDASFEHDACGVGFVADAGGRNRDRVVKLALAGLAALGHRGAFAADGESSDGAGVSLPLGGALLERLGADPGQAVLQLFLPRGRVRLASARELIESVLATEGLPIVRWRTVPSNPEVLGAAAAASAPAFRQVIVGRDDRETAGAFERRLLLARRRLENAARGLGLGEVAVASASSRLIVYKGLVAGGRLAALYPDLGGDLPLAYATFHQRYATNTQPAWALAQPFGLIAHNGEINTVRGNREQVRGRAGDTDPSGLLAELRARGALLSPNVSDSKSLDEFLELLVASGWALPTALLAAIPEATGLRRMPLAQVATLRRRTAALAAPWDGPAAIVFADGRRVGALLDRNGLRPLAYAMTRDGLVAAASEAGAVPLEPAQTIRRGRLGPGELLLVEPERRRILEDADAKAAILRRLPLHDAPRPVHADSPVARDLTGDETAAAAPHALRYLAGIDAERLRLDIRAMAIDAKEPLWSMGDDTPTPARGRVDRRVVDHLKQSFAQVTNPAIDPERELAVMDLRLELGRRPSLAGGLPRRPRTTRLSRPVVCDLDGLLELHREGSGGAAASAVRWLDATWSAAAGPAGLEAALKGLGTAAVQIARGRPSVLVLSDRRLSLEGLPIPSALAVGAVHTALTEAGLRGRLDLVAEAADVLDPHALAMTLAAGATAVHPWLAVECAAEVAGSRGAEALSPEAAIENLMAAFEGGLRKTLARMGISTAAAYVGSALFETLELSPGVIERCFPSAAAWPGRTGFEQLAERQLRRRAIAATMAAAEPASPGREPRHPDPGLARFRGDGELHLFSPRSVGHVQDLVAAIADDGRDLDAALGGYRDGLRREAAAVVRDDLLVRPGGPPVPLGDVEPAAAIIRRFVVSAMSVGALSPEAHQALTLGIQRAGGAANTGEGGEDPAWYRPAEGGARRDARIKQVASARFGVTATYLARAEQLEIKIAQGSKPGEGGQLPARKATAYIAALRRGQVGQAYISPPPHHDIYSIEDLAQLIADLRAINPTARIGVKLVATRGVGTIAAGVAKAGADYIHLSGHAGGTGASPLSSIKHAGAPWELGLAETHQTLLRNGLRERVALRTDGGLQTGRDIVVAALLGAEEFAFGTAALIAIGCDMARQCHLDTCPTGIATQREDLRAKFTGRPGQVEAFFVALAEDVRRELAASGASGLAEIIGAGRVRLAARRTSSHDLAGVAAASAWRTSPDRRADPAAAAIGVARQPASPLERRVLGALGGQASIQVLGLRITTAERSFGAQISGAAERAELRPPVHLELHGAAGQSFGAFATAGVHLRLVGQANDYVAKGLAGGRVEVVPEPDLRVTTTPTLAGNACLFGATGGTLHIVGAAGMRFAVRNSGAEAVVEGLGAHGCEYMTAGVVLILGSIGANFGAGMTGGRVYLLQPGHDAPSGLNAESVSASRLSEIAAAAPDGPARVDEVLRLAEAQRAVGSRLAAELLQDPVALIGATWLIEPRGSRSADGVHHTDVAVSPATLGASLAAPQAPRSTSTR
jgi:glutamate synthase domain-containing protein 2/glutamate synthase domain-containing protein 1/glutamate synthase domain-containing protein 3